MNSSLRSFTEGTANTPFKEIRGCLAALAGKLDISAVLLLTSSGELVAEHRTSSWKGDTTLFATLAASTYAAAREMARISGEPGNFRMVLHEGMEHNVYISALGGGYILIVCFPKSAAVGMVRLFTRKTAGRLSSLLSLAGKRTEHPGRVFNRQFQSLLDRELDRSFT
jgi:predicted regulator of Ras-like GTPase activity (Roadblock/LC7/MglB family)